MTFDPEIHHRQSIRLKGFDYATKQINVLRNNPGCPAWQRNYFERVIRNETELMRARDYIINNPLQWALDKENPANLRGGVPVGDSR